MDHILVYSNNSIIQLRNNKKKIIKKKWKWRSTGSSFILTVLNYLKQEAEEERWKDKAVVHNFATSYLKNVLSKIIFHKLNSILNFLNCLQNKKRRRRREEKKKGRKEEWKNWLTSMRLEVWQINWELTNYKFKLETSQIDQYMFCRVNNFFKTINLETGRSYLLKLRLLS